MENNKNNSANIAEENNNKTLLYVLGLVGILALIGLVVWYYNSGTKSKAKQDDTTLIKKAKTLIDNGFLGEKCAKSIKEHQAAKTTDKQASAKNLKDTYLKDKKDANVKEEYEKNKDNIAKAQQEINQQVGCYLMGTLNDDLEDLENLKQHYMRFDKDEKNTGEAKKRIKNALEKLKEANDAKDYGNRRKALQAAYEQLNECVTKSWWGSAYIPSEENKNKVDAELIKAKMDEINYICNCSPEKGEIEEYSSKSLDKALAEWENDYQELCNQYEVVKELELLKKKRKSSDPNTADSDPETD